MRRFAMIAALVVGLGIAWWLGSPLFIDRTVDEAFPLSQDLVLPAGMDEAEAVATMEAAATVDEMAAEPMGDEMAVASVLSSGSFRDVDPIHQGSGDASIYRLPDGSHVLRFEDLDVTNGPDLVVTLSSHPDPKSSDELHEGFVELEPLKGNLGDQNYLLPPDLDPTEIGSVAVYCRAFGVLFSVAPLSPSAEG